jgi:hypothetical protein
MTYLTLVPAYYDYQTAKAVKEAWAAGKDFRVCNAFSPDDGKACNKQDIKGPITLNIRYRGLTQIAQIKVAA